MMDQEKYREAVRTVRRSPALLERRGEYWSNEDKEKVDNLFNQGVGITEIAMILQRSESAVMQQIEKQDLYLRKQYPCRQKNCSTPAKCLCDTCIVDLALCPLHSTCRNVREDT